MCAPVLPCGFFGGSSCIRARASAIVTARRIQEPAPGRLQRSPPKQVRPCCCGLDWAGSLADSKLSGPKWAVWAHVRLVGDAHIIPCTLSSPRSSLLGLAVMPNVTISPTTFLNPPRDVLVVVRSLGAPGLFRSPRCLVQKSSLPRC